MELSSLQASLYLGLALMCGFVLYDTQLIIEKRRAGDRDFILHSVDLFVDLLGIFRRLVIILAQKVSSLCMLAGYHGSRVFKFRCYLINCRNSNNRKRNEEIKSKNDIPSMRADFVSVFHSLSFLIHFSPIYSHLHCKVILTREFLFFLNRVLKFMKHW
jgi:hypothetical protein